MWSTILSVLSKYWKQTLFILLLLGTFGAGWKANTLYLAEKENQEIKKEVAVKEALRVQEQKHAKDLLDIKELLDKREAQVIKVDVPKIIEKTIYKNVCMEEEGYQKLFDEREYARKLRGMK